MPKPLPDYIPGEIRDYIAANGYSGIMEYSEHVGLNPQRLLGVFGGNHGKIRPYWTFSRFAGCTMDELAGKMMAGEIGPYIESIAAREGLSIRALEMKCQTSEGFLSKKLKTGMYTNGLSGYIEVAHALGWSLEKLTKTCLR